MARLPSCPTPTHWVRNNPNTIQDSREVRRSILHLYLAYPVCAFFEDKRLVPGSRSRVPGTWGRVPGTGAESTPKVGHRAPSPATENAHTGFASCINFKF